MSTVQEIEEAISQLDRKDFEELAGWIDEQRDAVNAAALVFQMLDDAEEGEESQWLGN